MVNLNWLRWLLIALTAPLWVPLAVALALLCAAWVLSWVIADSLRRLIEDTTLPDWLWFR